MSLQYRNNKKVLKKSIGLVIAVTGVAVLVHFMPGWIWPLLAGIGLVSFGWFLFYHA